MGSVSPSESQQQTGGNNQIYGTSRQSEQPNPGSPGTFSPYRSGSVPIGFYALQRENVFPERPGQPECQFYMKTGDCKFGAVCRFHHPRERLIPTPDCVLSPIGLPLRPVSCLFSGHLSCVLVIGIVVVYGKCLCCFLGLKFFQLRAFWSHNSYRALRSWLFWRSLELWLITSPFFSAIIIFLVSIVILIIFVVVV